MNYSQDNPELTFGANNNKTKEATRLGHASPIRSVQKQVYSPKKTSNRLFGGFNQKNSSQSLFSIQNTMDPMDVLYDFSSIAKSKQSSEDVYYLLHNLIVSRMGLSFSALGILNSQSNCINIKLLDRIANCYNSRVLLNQLHNPIVKAFNDKIPQTIPNNTFLNIDYLSDSKTLILPMIYQGNCHGVLILGYSELSQPCSDLLQVLVDYLTLHIVNSQLAEKTSLTSDVDILTGLATHRSFQEKLSLELKKVQETGKPVSVVIFDVNNISQINREFGHAKGDEIIKLVSEKIKQNIRSVDVAGRYGGDEIALILPDTDNSEASYITEYLNYSLSCCLVDDVGTLKVSVGLATYPTCAKEQEKLLILAEQAMIISKNKGYKNGISVVVNAQDINFWNDAALDSFAAVIAKRHSQLGLNFEEELVNKFHNDSTNSNNHILDVVTSLAGAIDAKDTYTKGHSQSVSRYSEALARALNLPDEEVERIKLGALLHDVGKIGIPENVLGRQGKLEDDEWEIMRQHPVIGAEKVLAPVEALRDLIPIVKHHHEHWDGSGYPSNLKGEEIPLAARIVAVADTFHALISDRPYRKGLPIEKAVEILRVGSGIQWDKELVRKFITIAPSLITTI
ncbi:MAG: diguanylate cyclase [Candidatus Gastranaerophilales bacterium]|nr:diguanylate cyclase [Candidatus Gastranaerophilales bacterium]